MGLDLEQVRRTREELARSKPAEASETHRGAIAPRKEDPGEERSTPTPTQTQAQAQEESGPSHAFSIQRGSALANTEVMERLRMATREGEAWTHTKRPTCDLLLSAQDVRDTARRSHGTDAPAPSRWDAGKDPSPPITRIHTSVGKETDTGTPGIQQPQTDDGPCDVRASPTHAPDGRIAAALPPSRPPSVAREPWSGTHLRVDHAPAQGSDDEDIFEGVGRGTSMEPEEGVPKVGILAGYSSSDASEEADEQQESDGGMEGPSLPRGDYAMYPTPEELEAPHASQHEPEEPDSAGSPLPPAPVPVSKEALRALQEERQSMKGVDQPGEEPRWKVKRSRDELLKELEGKLEGGEYDAVDDEDEEDMDEKKKKAGEEEEEEKGAKSKVKGQKKAKLNQEYQKIQSLLKRKEETKEGFQIKVQGTEGQGHGH